MRDFPIYFLCLPIHLQYGTTPGILTWGDTNLTKTLSSHSAAPIHPFEVMLQVNAGTGLCYIIRLSWLVVGP